MKTLNLGKVVKISQSLFGVKIVSDNEWFFIWQSFNWILCDVNILLNLMKTIVTKNVCENFHTNLMTFVFLKVCSLWNIWNENKRKSLLYIDMFW